MIADTGTKGGHGKGEIDKSHHNALKHDNISHKDYNVVCNSECGSYGD